MKILCIGSFTKDTFIKIENKVDFNNPNRTHFSAEKVEVNFGGCASNIAYGLAKNGINTSIFGALKEEDYIEKIRSMGVCLINKNKNKEIDKYIIISEKNKQRITFFNRGSGDDNFLLNEDDLTGYSDILISSEEKKNMKLAKKLSLKLNKHCHIDAGGEIYNMSKSEILNLITNSKTIFVNNKELHHINQVGINNKTLTSSCSHLIITHGNGGAELFQKDKRFFKESPKINYVDETGCGDAFRAGFLSAMYSSTDNWESRNPSEWLQKGHIMAAKCIATIGGQNY